MNKIILSHIYNEEYLLPWWLNHHKKYFDHGIIIDYNSTDSSLEIIKKICPEWEIYNSKNYNFSAIEVDKEILEYEYGLKDSDWKIVLNTTEFLIGNFKLLDNILNSQLLIPCFYFIDEIPFRESEISYENNLWDVLKFGLDINQTMNIRRARNFHNIKLDSYPIGRHYNTYNTEDFIIFNYGFAPMTQKMYNRKLQIQTKIPKEDFERGFGTSHKLTVDKMLKYYYEYHKLSENLENKMLNFINKLEEA